LFTLGTMLLRSPRHVIGVRDYAIILTLVLSCGAKEAPALKAEDVRIADGKVLFAYQGTGVRSGRAETAQARLRGQPHLPHRHREWPGVNVAG
jgi:hypothetical protein